MDFLIHHILQASARRYPDKEALVHGDERLSYHQVAERVSGLGHGLRAAGLRRGDRMGIYLDASVPQALSIFGVSQADGVYVPISGLLFAEQVAHIARDCQMKGLITTRQKLASLAQILKEISSLEFVVLVGDREPVDAPVPSYYFDDLCGQRPAPPSGEEAIDKDPAAILYTSGSTGKPKGVMLSHAQVLAGSSIVSTYLEITEADRILAVLPFSFDAGMNQLITAFHQGATLVLINFVFAREVVQTLAQERISGLAGVPTFWSLMSQPSSALHKRELPDLRYVTNTGGAMPQNVLATLRRLLPKTRVFLMYGLTEAFRSTYLPPEELDRRPTSIGKAIPNTEILVVNEKGQLCGPGEVGELVHRGPTVSMGYWGQPELTAKVLRPNPLLPPERADTVCYSGDYVKMDEAGFLYFIGRRDTMIKSSGFRISPTEVEDVLFRSGLVKGAAVVGIPDGILGQSIKAFVVARDGEPVDPERLREFCAVNMPRHMLPGAIEVLDELPKTTSGKVDYAALRRREDPARG
jgi:acyl-CoA ligase (AMP-forming) (exosortase A-associated)